MISIETAVLAFVIYNAALYLIGCWRDRLIREMRCLHAEQLAAERRLSSDIAAERDVYRKRYLDLMSEDEEVES